MAETYLTSPDVHRCSGVHCWNSVTTKGDLCGQCAWKKQQQDHANELAAAKRAVIDAAEAWADREAAYHGDNWSFRRDAELDARSALRDAVRALRALQTPAAPGKERDT